MQFMEDKNMSGLLLLVDFEKVFDSLSWVFIHKVLKVFFFFFFFFFNFGPSIQRWISVFLKSTPIRVNQVVSSPFRLERGCKQGDPISAYIFILRAEILAIKIRNNETMKRIKINNIDFKLEQFVDDTTIILDGSVAEISYGTIF